MPGTKAVTPLRRKSTLWALLTGVMVLATVALMAASTVALEGHAAQSLKAEVALADVAHNVDGARLVGLAYLSGAKDPSDFDAQREKALQAKASRYAGELTRLSPLGAVVAPLVRELNTAMSAEMAALLANREEAAQAIDSSHADRLYAQLERLFSQDDSLLARQAQQSQDEATKEVVGLFVASAALVVGVLSGFEASGRRRAKGEVQVAAQARFEAMVANGSDLLVVTGADGVVSYVSPSARHLLGYEPGTLVGKPFEDLFHPDDRHLLALAHEAPRDLRSGHADGKWRTMDPKSSDLSGVADVKGTLWALRDVTDQRHLEAQLRLAQKMESVGQLAAGIAHEINTPVQFIGDNIRFIAEAFATLAEVAPTDDPELEFLVPDVAKAAAQAIDGVDRVARIVRAMRYFGHPANEDKTSVDLNEAVRNTLVVATSEVKYVAEVVTELADIAPVWGHRGDINQVLLNLVVNAAHSVGDKVAGTGERGNITLRTWCDGDRAYVSVSDTGTGIPDAVASRMFEPFFTTKEPGKGTGQGLALVYTLVKERHGGEISFVTEIGAGTTFTIRLPLAAAPALAIAV